MSLPPTPPPLKFSPLRTAPMPRHPATVAKWIHVWFLALEQEIGIRFAVRQGDKTHFRNLLYEARDAANDPRLHTLSALFASAPHDNEIWICKKAVEIEPDAHPR